MDSLHSRLRSRKEHLPAFNPSRFLLPPDPTSTHSSLSAPPPTFHTTRWIFVPFTISIENPSLHHHSRSLFCNPCRRLYLSLMELFDRRRNSILSRQPTDFRGEAKKYLLLCCKIHPSLGLLLYLIFLLTCSNCVDFDFVQRVNIPDQTLTANGDRTTTMVEKSREMEFDTGISFCMTVHHQQWIIEEMFGIGVKGEEGFPYFALKNKVVCQAMLPFHEKNASLYTGYNQRE